MTLDRLVYNAVVLPLAAAGVAVATRFHPKLREAVDGRRGFRARWYGLRTALQQAPVWFHVSSVGEFEQAKPLISQLRQHHPDIPVVLTFSSPSGCRFARRKETLDADNNIKFIDYLPADFARNMRYCLDAARPRLLVLVKFDIWPNLVWETRSRGIPLVLIDATLSPSSGRLSRLARAFYARIYGALSKILAISEADAGRFRDAVPHHDAITVSGDTRFDRVMERRRGDTDTGVTLPCAGRKVLIAGSTWPRDEAHVLRAVADLFADDPRLLFMVAPHEPSPERVEELLAWARESNLGAKTSGQAFEEGDQVLIVDTVGILAELYRLADVAYIGGGFSTGVHSVIEPAIVGIPVLFGPRHDNSFEALRLIEEGGGFTVSNRTEVLSRLRALLYDDDERERAGSQARAYVESQLGATEKCLEAIREYL